MGIFGVFLPLIFGKGRENAFRRLREEVDRCIKRHEFNKLPESNIENQPKSIDREDIIQEVRPISDNREALTENASKDRSVIIKFNKGPKNKNPALHRAAWCGRDIALENLLQRYSSANVLDEDGEAALQKSAWNGHEECVRIILKKSAIVNHGGGNYGDPLEIAARRGHTSIVESLLQAGATSKDSALQKAAENGHVAIVSLLLDHGADPRSEDPYGTTVLHAAAAGGKVEILQMLLKTDACGDLVAEEDTEHMTPLHFAVEHGHRDAAVFLIDEGADPHATASYFAGSIIHSACNGGHTEIAEKLLIEGVNPNQDGGHWISPLHASCRSGKIEVVDLLLRYQADVNIIGYGDENKIGRHNETALNSALMGGHTTIALRLIEAGADIINPFKMFDQPLCIASKQGNDIIVRTLLQRARNAGQKMTNYINFSVHATFSGRDMEIETEEEFDPRTKECIKYSSGRRQIWDTGHMAVLKLLLEEYADINFVCRCRYDSTPQRTPLCMAMSNEPDRISLGTSGHPIPKSNQDQK